MKYIAHIENGFDEKFGIPRQAGLTDIESFIVFEEEYRNADAVRGLEGFSHIWIIWETSESKTETFSPTVRPPRLGGNVRMGVFATRSPFRPNPIGLSCVRLDGIKYDEKRGPVLRVLGADIMNGTPIYDIKPYVPYADCKTDAKEGFATPVQENMEIIFSCDVPKEIKKDLEEILRFDPRPRYHEDGREYGFSYAGYEIKFTAEGNKIKVKDISSN